MSEHRCDPAYRFELKDALGIFCTFACYQCVERKKGQFRAEIFTNPNYAAEAGEQVEEDY